MNVNIVIVFAVVIAVAAVAFALRLRSAMQLTDEEARREAGVSEDTPHAAPKLREW